MGKGKRYTCKKCKNDYSLYLGIGMLYPQVFKEAIEDIKKGEYGVKLKEIINSGELIVPDAETYLYYCEQCEEWEQTEDLSLYQPKDIEAIKKKQFGIKTVEEWGEIPYATQSDFETDYKLVYKNIHLCPKCNKEMTRYDDRKQETDIFKKLPCPNCKTKNEPNGFINWD